MILAYSFLYSIIGKDKVIQNNYGVWAYTLLRCYMNREYKVNNIFNENGVTLNELMSNYLISFLDKEFNIYENNGIINTDVISNL